MGIFISVVIVTYNKLYLLLSLVFYPLILHSEENVLTSTLAEAKVKNLSQREEWLSLNQFWNNILGVQVSRIDEAEYFVSQSKYDPNLELESFIKKVIEKDEYLLGDKSIQCRFPARFFWLNKELLLSDRGIIKLAECKEFNEWKNTLDVSRVVLVFPAAYLNNPASMFGHTLLRLDSSAGIDNPLLSYAASFGAATGNDGGVAFAIKGLFGGYRASFTVEPYYETVNRYGDIEHRDIWEYELLLNHQERETLVKGLWEYGHTFVDYYFFDENCSYYLLTLLDIVRPNLGLSKKFSYWAIPSDTLREVLKVENILGSIKFRPSLTKKLEEQAKKLNSEQINQALDIAEGRKNIIELGGFEELEKAYVLELSFDYLEYLNSKKRGEDINDRSIAQSILKERSVLPSINKRDDFLDMQTRPDFAHKSGRAFFSLGRKSNRSFYDFQIKPAYHDVLDSPLGFVKGAAIDFLNIGMRQYEEDNFQLQFLNLINIESYSPFTKVFTPSSWAIKFGYERKTIPRLDSNDLEGSSAAFFSGSYGLTVNPLEKISFSFLPSVKFNYAPSFLDQDYAISAGAISKLIFFAKDDLRFLLSGEHHHFELGEKHQTNQLGFEVNYDLSIDTIIRAGIQRQSSFSQYFNEFYLGLGVYF